MIPSLPPPDYPARGQGPRESRLSRFKDLLGPRLRGDDSLKFF